MSSLQKVSAEATPWYGTAGHGETPFSCNLITEIEPNLWLGGCIDGVTIADDFKYVVSLYPWEEYKLPEGCSRVSVRMYDSNEEPDSGLIFGLGALVNHFKALGKTLVHCQAGLNRSSLVMAASFILEGSSGDEAVSVIRAKRCEAALCNPAFEAWVRAQVPPRL